MLKSSRNDIPAGTLIFEILAQSTPKEQKVENILFNLINLFGYDE